MPIILGKRIKYLFYEYGSPKKIITGQELLNKKYIFVKTIVESGETEQYFAIDKNHNVIGEIVFMVKRIGITTN